MHFFREHHKYPYLMLERDWIDTNAEITAACLGGCVLLACILQPIGLLDGSFWNLVAAWGSLCGPTISSVHALTHLKNPPAWYRVGSYFGVICTKEHHKKHHEAFRTCYSLYLGLVDTFFDSLRVLEGVELFIYIVWGVIAVNTRLDHFMFLDGETTFQQRWCNAKANWATALRSSVASRAGVVTFACTCGAAAPRAEGGAAARTAKADARAANAVAGADAGAATRGKGAARGGTGSRVVERLDLALYKRVLAASSLRGKTLVDVSCGVGNSLVALAADPNPNGANAPKECIGIDLSNVNIVRAERRFPMRTRPASVRFSVASAEKLPLADASADIVLSVEAAHALSDVALFVAEARRVLRPGGRLCVADYGGEAHFGSVRAAAKRERFTIAEDVDMTACVLAALGESRDERARLQRLSTPWWGVFFCGAPLTEGAAASRVELALTRGRRTYRRFVLVHTAEVAESI